jgi:hypothetical protein
MAVLLEEHDVVVAYVFRTVVVFPYPLTEAATDAG